MPSAPTHRAVTTRHVLALDGDDATERAETLAGEQPLQIRARGHGEAPVEIAVTMRTPGNEDELAAGFLLTEGLVTVAELTGARFVVADPAATSQPENEITVELAAGFDGARVAS